MLKQKTLKMEANSLKVVEYSKCMKSNFCQNIDNALKDCK